MLYGKVCKDVLKFIYQKMILPYKEYDKRSTYMIHVNPESIKFKYIDKKKCKGGENFDDKFRSAFCSQKCCQLQISFFLLQNDILSWNIGIPQLLLWSINKLAI